MAGTKTYNAPDKPCSRCGGMVRRVLNRACQICGLRRSRKGWSAIKAGLRPDAKQSRPGYLDALARQRRERAGESISRTWETADPPGTLTVTRWPTGRTEVLFPDGHREADLGQLDGRHVHRLRTILPELGKALAWAGWG